MDVLNIEEQEDGSAIVTLNMTEKENDILVEHAVIDILKKQIERIENEQGTNWDGE
jgi:DNA recombination-dependent growth factor C